MCREGPLLSANNVSRKARGGPLLCLHLNLFESTNLLARVSFLSNPDHLFPSVLDTNNSSRFSFCYVPWKKWWKHYGLLPVRVLRAVWALKAIGSQSDLAVKWCWLNRTGTRTFGARLTALTSRHDLNPMLEQLSVAQPSWAAARKTGHLRSGLYSPKFDHLCDYSWLANISWRLPGAHDCCLVNILGDELSNVNSPLRPWVRHRTFFASAILQPSQSSLHPAFRITLQVLP